MTTTTRYYSTRQACRALGVSRATLYNWGAAAQADLQGPGDRGTLGWTRETLQRIAAEHDRQLDYDGLD